MKNTFKIPLFCVVFLEASLLSVLAAQPSQRLDGVWVGTEKLSLAKQMDFPKPTHETLPAKIAVARGGTLLAVVEGYGPTRYLNLHWSGDTLVFELENMRKGELRLSSDGKTLIERGYVRRSIPMRELPHLKTPAPIYGFERPGYWRPMAGPKTVSTDHGQATGVFINCLDELTGTFHREK